MQIIIGILVLLHSLVHMWYVTLSQNWVAFQADMGWNGNSRLLTGLLGNNLTRGLATLLFGLSTVAFIGAGFGLLTNQGWTRVSMIVASAIFIITILVFWDGKLNMLVEKGLLGFLISAGILLAALISK